MVFNAACLTMLLEMVIEGICVHLSSIRHEKIYFPSGLSFLLADALKPQSRLIDGFVTNPFYCRELVFTKESDGRYTDYQVKEGTSALRDTVSVLEVAAAGQIYVGTLSRAAEEPAF